MLVNWHEDGLHMVLDLSLSRLLLFHLLVLLLHILNGQLVEVFLASQTLEHLHAALEKTAKGDQDRA